MTDNTNIKNAAAATVAVATDELSDSSQSPKVTLLDGTGSPVGISPATETTLASAIKAEDAVHSSGDKGIMALGVRKDTATALATTDGDYQPFIFDSSGKLHVAATVSSGSTAGDVAHDAVDSGNPLKIGGYAKAAAPSDVSADGDRVNAWLLRNGAQAVNLTAAGALIPGDATTGLAVGGAVAHDGVDSGNPNKVGGRTIAHGTNPTAVAAADRTDWYFNRAGIPFVIGGHPNVVSKGHIITDSDGAQTDAALVGSISSGTKVVVTRMSVVCDNANTGDCAVTIGFGATNTPTPSLSGVAGVIVNGSFDGGAGITLGDGSGILGVGGDGEELRITSSDPVGGNIRVSYSYYTIES